MQLSWTSDLDRVADTRLRCYAPSVAETDKFRAGIRTDRRAGPGDYLIADVNGEAVGTTTSMRLNMWVRGARLSCQGVAYVGTTRTHRRGAGGTPGIASALMTETLRVARDREHVVTALMPFRASFYEHFGYGLVERRNDWTVPLTIIPTGDCGSFKHFEPSDIPLIATLRQSQVQLGQCDIETDAGGWATWGEIFKDGFVFVDRPSPAAPARSWFHLSTLKEAGKTIARVEDWNVDSPDSFQRLIRFVGTLRDQYAAMQITLPVDLPLNLLLSETQIPHRPVEHAAATLQTHTRMQVRILDYTKFFEKLQLPDHVAGSAVVSVRETEGVETRLLLEFSSGRVTARPSSATPDLACTDVRFATFACGEIPATKLAQFGLIESKNATALTLLDSLANGPAPFCGEYF